MQTAEKQEFIAYLEKSGVIDILTKAFVTLFEEQGRPDSPLEYDYIRLDFTRDLTDFKID
jgi:hypothetical protein